MILVTLDLALPSEAKAATVSAALVEIGLNVDTKPMAWPGTARPVSVKAFGAPQSNVDETLLPLHADTDYEILARTEEQG